MKMMKNPNELIHKGRQYFYGYQKIRDFPTRGRESTVFIIKMKIGVKPFNRLKIIVKTQDVHTFFISDDKIEEYVIKEIDNYILKSRVKKLRILTNKKK